jgi:hypothetical protein
LAVSDNKLKLEVKSVLFLEGQFFGSDIAVNDYLLSWDRRLPRNWCAGKVQRRFRDQNSLGIILQFASGLLFCTASGFCHHQTIPKQLNSSANSTCKSIQSHLPPNPWDCETILASSAKCLLHVHYSHIAFCFLHESRLRKETDRSVSKCLRNRKERERKGKSLNFSQPWKNETLSFLRHRSSRCSIYIRVSRYEVRPPARASKALHCCSPDLGKHTLLLLLLNPRTLRLHTRFKLHAD